MNNQILVSCEELAAHLDDPDWRIIDCRFDLAQTESGREAYREGHIPGAIYAHLDEDLSGRIDSTTGRHPLPDPDDLQETFSRWGIGPDTQVICYDSQQNAFAGRLWFLLRWLGHARVAVLDGGLRKWEQEGRQLTTDTPPIERREFRGIPNNALLISSDDILDHLDADDTCLIDVRKEERFSGDEEPIDPVAGHIPGAVNLCWEKNLDAGGCYLPAEALNKMYSRILGDTPVKQCAVMCGSGVSACQTLVALELAGVSGTRLYAGSWSEWIRDPGRPVEIGLGD